MASMIRKFLDKKKRDAKFKLAGPGYKLTEGASSINAISGKDSHQRSEPCSDAKQAGKAALARNYGGGPSSSSSGYSMYNIIETEGYKEMETDILKLTSTNAEQGETDVQLAVEGVYYRCPVIGPEILSREEWKTRIRDFLYDDLEDERGLTACLIIHSLNKDKDKIQLCISTLSAYLENIIYNPTEEKYQRIRLLNKVFVDRISKMEGALEFLKAAGFENKILHFKESEEEFLVYNSEMCDIETLKLLVDALQNAEPITIELDRNMRILLSSQVLGAMQLPDEFFSISLEDLKREHQLRAERLDNALQLKTKAMREKEEQKALKKYKFSIIRIRFPDGVFLQGTFSVFEKFQAVREFVRENLLEQGQFILSTGVGHQIVDSDDESSLLELKLVPASILIFAWNQEEIITTFLKPELLELIENI